MSVWCLSGLFSVCKFYDVKQMFPWAHSTPTDFNIDDKMNKRLMMRTSACGQGACPKMSNPQNSYAGESVVPGDGCHCWLQPRGVEQENVWDNVSSCSGGHQDPCWWHQVTSSSCCLRLFLPDELHLGCASWHTYVCTIHNWDAALVISEKQYSGRRM